MTKSQKKPIKFLIILIILGQLAFLTMSGKYTTPKYESKIFTTTGFVYDGTDLHKLNEAAHYFGQTMIGWTKFPNFKSDLIKYTSLPVNADINMYVQERQNFIFTVTTKKSITFDELKKVKDFLQKKIDEYNLNTKTKFVLTNVDYEQAEIVRSYSFGALFTLVLSIAIGLAILFVRKEFFPPKLKL